MRPARAPTRRASLVFTSYRVFNFLRCRAGRPFGRSFGVKHTIPGPVLFAVLLTVTSRIGASMRSSVFAVTSRSPRMKLLTTDTATPDSLASLNWVQPRRAISSRTCSFQGICRSDFGTTRSIFSDAEPFVYTKSKIFSALVSFVGD